MSWTALQKKTMLNNFNVVAQRTRLGDLVFGAVGGGAAPLDYTGRVYFVNNATGSDSNDGLSWATAFEQVSAALAAAEVYRLTLVAAHASDVGIRSVIYVAGTLDAYDAIPTATQLPSHCDVIGVGDESFGNGQGVALIGLSGASGLISSAPTNTVRGLRFYNLQFATGTGAFHCVSLTGAFLRGGFFNCGFNVTGTNTTGAALNIAATFAGNTIRGCWFGGDSGYPAYGIKVAAGLTFNNNLIEDNTIGGTTAAFEMSDGTAPNDVNTVIKHNVIGNEGSARGIHDHGAHALWINNWCMGSSDAIDVTGSTNPTLRFVDNYENTAGTTTRYAAIS